MIFSEDRRQISISICRNRAMCAIENNSIMLSDHRRITKGEVFAEETLLSATQLCNAKREKASLLTIVAGSSIVLFGVMKENIYFCPVSNVRCDLEGCGSKHRLTSR